jgi:prolyl 4-hydroxylase
MTVASVFEQTYAQAAGHQAWGEARRCLEAGVRAGDAFSCAQLGVWHLLGNVVARDDSAGFQLVERAARAGDSDARRLTASLYARGRGVTASWGRAVEWLVRAARDGDARAMRQLAVLLPADQPEEGRLLAEAIAGLQAPWSPLSAARAQAARAALTRDRWRRIMSAARRPTLPLGEAEVVAHAPQVMVRRQVLGRALREHLVGLAAPLLARARVNDPVRGAERVDASRTNTFANFWLLEGDVVTDCVDRLLAELTGLPYATGETLSVLHYAPGEQFAPHFDFFDPLAPSHAGQIAREGQRIATCLVYLNDGYTGGATSFVDAGVEVRGGPGDAVYWHNVDAQGEPDRRTRHAGLPPTTGEKWIVSKWFRDRAQSQGGPDTGQGSLNRP